MAYITPADLIVTGAPSNSWISDLVSRTSDAAMVAVCESASSTADSYFANRFGVPLPTPSAETKRRVRHVAIYDLLVARGIAPDNPGHMLVVNNYQDALRWFEACAKGSATPTLLPDATPSEEEGAPFVTSEPSRGWT